MQSYARSCAVIGFLFLLSFTGCGGGGSSPQPPSNPSNPVPSISSISPSSVIAGSTGFTLTVNGSNFLAGSSILWNGAAKATTYVSATQLTAAITTADVASGADISVTVSNPAPGGGSSAVNHFAINNPSPAITAVSPSPITAVHEGSALTVTGTGFVNTSTILWGGTPRTTTFVSNTQLQTTITSADVATLAAVNISVRNTAPGGGDAPAAQVSVENAAPVLTSLSPSVVVVGSNGFTLAVNGAGFASNSVVRWNGGVKTTTYVSRTKLTVPVSATEVAAIGTAEVSVYTPAPGGGSSTPLTFTISDVPVPVIATLSPNTAFVNSPDLTIAVYGQYLLSTSVVQFNGVDLATSYGYGYPYGGPYLFATIPAANLVSLGSFPITVRTPGNPDKISNSLTFGVLANPVPSVSYISPEAAPVGSGDVQLTVSGTNLVGSSVVRWNGSPVQTTNSGNQLIATIPAAALTSFGNNSVTVFNPAPGGGESAAVNFSTYLPLATNDIVYNSYDGKLYASVPSTGSVSLGNSIVTIDPYTGNVSNPIWVGSEPGKLALSSDGTTLWVVLNGSSSIRKVDLSTKTATATQVYFPGDAHVGLSSFTDLAVMPGAPNTVAVSYGGTVTIVDGTVKRAKTASGSFLAFGSSANTLYSTGGYGGYSVFTLDGTGIASTKNYSISSYAYGLKYDSGRVYLTSGAVLDADAGTLLGTFSSAGPLAPDSSVGRTFILNNGTQYSYSFDRVTAYDSNTMVPVGTEYVSGVSSDAGQANTTLVRFGQNGLAIRTSTQLYLIRSNLVRDLSSSAVDLAVSVTAPAAASTGANLTFTTTVQNKGTNSASNVVLTNAIPSGTSFVSFVASQGTCAGSAVLRCNLGTLASGGSATLSVVVTPLAAGTSTDSATVSAVEPDSDLSNNSASSSVAITGQAYYAQPTITDLSPSVVIAGADTFTLTITGGGFSSGSVVKLGASDLPTTYISDAQLSATVDKSMVASLGWAPVTVSTPAPGGGISNSLTLMTIQVISLDTNDIVFDPFSRKIWASIPSTATQVTGNSFVDIDPASGTIGSSINMGSEPSRLCLTDNGQYLYTSLRGSKEVRRMDVPSKTPGVRFTATDYWNGAYAVDDLAAMPGHPDSIAASGYSSDVQVYDISGSTVTKRGDGGFVYSGVFLGWTDPTHLFSYDSGLSPSKIHRFNVGASSVTEVDATNVSGFWGHFENYNGLLYSDGGGVVDPSPAYPAPPQLVGRFAATGVVAIDGGARRAYFDTTGSYLSPAPPKGIVTYSMDTYGQVGYMSLPVGNDWQTTHADLVRWGRDGLAFRMYNNYQPTPGSGRLVLLRGPIVTPEVQFAHASPSLSSLSPSSVAAHSGNLWVTVTGTGFVPGAAVLWNGQERSTTFVNSTTLKVAIPASDLAQPTTASVTAVNPNSTASTSLSFTIN